MSINVKPSRNHDDYPQCDGDYLHVGPPVLAVWLTLIALCITFWGVVGWVVGLW